MRLLEKAAPFLLFEFQMTALLETPALGSCTLACTMSPSSTCKHHANAVAQAVNTVQSTGILKFVGLVS